MSFFGSHILDVMPNKVAGERGEAAFLRFRNFKITEKESQLRHFTLQDFKSLPIAGKLKIPLE